MTMLLSSTETVAFITLLIVLAVYFAGIFLMFIFRYKKCPSDKIMVIYGKVGKTEDGAARSAICIHGGAKFIWPFVQRYTFLDLTPIPINIELRDALSNQNTSIDFDSRFTVGISTETGVMQNAAERLLGLKQSDIRDLAQDMILGQLRLAIVLRDMEEINKNRDKFLDEVARNVEAELKKVGLRLINININSIRERA